MKKTRLRNAKGQFKKASKISEFGFVNLSTYTSPEIKEVNGEANSSIVMFANHTVGCCALAK